MGKLASRNELEIESAWGKLIHPKLYETRPGWDKLAIRSEIESAMRQINPSGVE